MSIPSRRASTGRGIPLSMPPPTPPALMSSHGGVPNRVHEFVMPRFISQGSQESLGGEESGVDLQRRRVLPPTALGGRPSHGLYEDSLDKYDQEEFPGAMNSRTYFSNLMASAFNYHSACGDKHPDVIRPIEASDEPIAVEDGNGDAKEKRRTKNFNVDEDKLLMST